MGHIFFSQCLFWRGFYPSFLLVSHLCCGLYKCYQMIRMVLRLLDKFSISVTSLYYRLWPLQQEFPLYLFCWAMGWFFRRFALCFLVPISYWGNYYPSWLHQMEIPLRGFIRKRGYNCKDRGKNGGKFRHFFIGEADLQFCLDALREAGSEGLFWPWRLQVVQGLAGAGLMLVYTWAATILSIQL